LNLPPEVLAEVFRQSAFISALIAGFAIAATAGLVVCSLGWTFSVPRVLSLAAGDPPGSAVQLPDNYRMIHRYLSMTFIACFFFFLTSLGLSGWIRSRTLGIVSAAIAAAAAIFAIWLMRFFVS
jgi:hypothetical protein